MIKSRIRFTLTLLASAAILPGCIVRDIHDQMSAVNECLLRVEQQLDATNERLVRLDKQIDERLSMLESTNRTLASIDESLKKSDVHLASLRRTISSIDSAVPFLKFSDKPEAPEAKNAPNDTAPVEAKDADTGG